MTSVIWDTVESMAKAMRESYQSEGGLEDAIVDLVRVGTTGFGPGVRQLAARLVRAIPPGVQDAEGFRSAVNEAIAVGAASAVGLRFASGEVPTSDDGGLELADVNPFPSVRDFVASDRIARDFDELIQERAQASELARAGIPLTRTVLLSGPPGVGKTVGATWLASQLGLPLVTISLAAVTSSYLGSSGRNLRAVFEYAKSGPCVLFLDEFDALAKRRDDESDIGELKRLVNVILVELDRWTGESLIVAATNHAQLLDPAVDRRFDRTIDFDLPAASERLNLLVGLASQSGSAESLNDVLDLMCAATDGQSCSDIERTWWASQRRALLRGERLRRVLLEELLHGQEVGPDRDRVWALAEAELGLSHRQVAAIAGVTHPTVSAAIKRARVDA